MYSARIFIAPSWSTYLPEDADQLRMTRDVMKRGTRIYMNSTKSWRKGPDQYFVDEQGRFRTGLLRELLRVHLDHTGGAVAICSHGHEAEAEIVAVVTSRSEIDDSVKVALSYRAALHTLTKFGDYDSGIYQRTTSGLDIEHRDYQVAAARHALAAKQGIIEAPVGAGKTAMIAHLVEQIEGRILILTPWQRTSLAVDLHDSMRKFGIKGVSLVKGSDLVNSRVVCASTPTLVNRLKKNPARTGRWLAKFDAVIRDECHEHTEREYPVLDACIGAHYRIGLSGTPWREKPVHDMLTRGLWGEVCFRVGNEYLQERGNVARPTIFMLRLKHGPHDEFENYREFDRYLSGLVWRNKLIAELAKWLDEKGHRVVVSTSNVNPHAGNLQRLMRRAGMAADVYTGALGIDERKMMLRNFASGRTRYLVCSRVFDTGVSVNEISAIVLAGPIGRSAAPTRTLQTMGRGVRVGSGTKHMVLVDIWDMVSFGVGQGQNRRRLWKKAEGVEVIEVDDVDALKRAVTHVMKEWENGTGSGER